MGISVSNIISKGVSAYTKIKSGFSKESELSLGKFLSILSNYGTITNCNYEVSFSGITNLSFFCQSITTPGFKQNFTNISYDGQIVEVPQNSEYEHDFTMTILNDGKGVIYTAFQNFILDGIGTYFFENGYTVTIKILSNNQSSSDGIYVVLNGVRFRNISGLQLDASDSSLSKFTLACSAISYTISPESLRKVTSVLGAIKDITDIFL